MPPPRALPALQRLLPGVYYGWTIAVALCLQSVVVAGVGFYGMVVLLHALSEQRGWPLAEISLATTLYFWTGAAVGSAIGRSVDRHGPRGWMVAGAVLMAAALWLVGGVESPAQLYLVYPLLAAGGAMAGGVPANATVTRWFAARRARAMSIAHTGVSIGGVLLVPFATALIVEHGIATATRVLAVLVLAVVLPSVAFVLRRAPEEHGLEVDGDPVRAQGRPELDRAVQMRLWRARQAARTRPFWLLVVGFSGVSFCQLGVAMHQLEILSLHLDPKTAALGVSATAFGSFGARLVVGSFADRVAKGRLVFGLVLIQCVGYAAFATGETPLALFGASLCFGCAIGNLFMLLPLMVAETFGVVSFGRVSGLLQLLVQATSALGPFALGLLRSELGGYGTALPALAVLALLSAGLLTRVRAPGA